MSDVEGPVLVATDLGEAGNEAVRQAASWAQRLGAPLAAIHVAPGGRGASEARQQKFSETIASLVPAQLPFEAIVGEGAPVPAIMDEAERVAARLIVVGTGEGPHFLGGVAEQIVRHASVAVLVGRPSPKQGAVLGATDFSDDAAFSVATAVVYAALVQAPLALMHSVDVPSSPLDLLGPLVVSTSVPSDFIESERAAAETLLKTTLKGCGAQGEVFVREGAPARAIVRLASELGASLVVVGTKGRTGFSRAVIGSVAERVLRSAPCSVLVARGRAKSVPAASASETRRA